MERKVIRIREDLVDADEGYGVFAGNDGRHKGVEGDEIHAKGTRPPRDLDADASKTDDAEGFAAQFGALQRLLLPLAGVHGCVGAGDAACHGDHESERELRDGDGVCTRGVHDDDAAMGGGRRVNVVDTHARAADDTEPGRMLQQGGRNLHGAAHHERIGIGELGFEAVPDPVRRYHGPRRLLLKDGKRCR